MRKRHFRLALCGHKAVEAGAVCVLLMVQGNLAEATVAHFAVAAKTGLLAVSPALAVTFSRHARHVAHVLFLNRWISSAFLGLCTFAADALAHPSHYPGAYTEAALTGLGAAAFSLVVSYTPLGKKIDRLAETFLHVPEPAVPHPRPTEPALESEPRA
jgi:hypothetical protein